MTTELAPGVVIEGRYRVDRLLGEGGMGEVWAGTNLVMESPCALKVLSKGRFRSKQARDLFKNEAQLASRVNHGNVVKVFDFREPGGVPMMVMELLEGETLRDRLDREGVLSFDVAAPMLLQLVSAIGTAHAKGVVHRDLKPENVFLCSACGDPVDLRVLDFGIAKCMRPVVASMEEYGGATRAVHIMGTAEYMSLEQARGEPVDHRTDIWSLGVLIYELLTGGRPVEGRNLADLLSRLEGDEVIDPIRELVPEVPADVCALIDRMLQMRAEDRLPDLREALHVLKRYANVPVKGFPAPQPEVPLSTLSSPYSAPIPFAAADDVAADMSTDLVGSSPTELAPSTERHIDAAPDTERPIERAPESRSRAHREWRPRPGRAAAATASALSIAAVAWGCWMRPESVAVPRLPRLTAPHIVVQLSLPVPDRRGVERPRASLRDERAEPSRSLVPAKGKHPSSTGDQSSEPRASQTPPPAVSELPLKFYLNDPTWSPPALPLYTNN